MDIVVVVGEKGVIQKSRACAVEVVEFALVVKAAAGSLCANISQF